MRVRIIDLRAGRVVGTVSASLLSGLTFGGDREAMARICSTRVGNSIEGFVDPGRPKKYVEALLRAYGRNRSTVFLAEEI